jgi:flagellin
MTTAFTISGMASATSGSAEVTTTSSGEPYLVTPKPGTAVTSASMSSIQAASSAQSAMANLDYMIKVVDSKRAELGAVQNRFDSTIRNQANISENVSAARSRIRDADFATETANLTKQNILQQAASTILSQANQRPQSALSLLQG